MSGRGRRPVTITLTIRAALFARAEHEAGRRGLDVAKWLTERIEVALTEVETIETLLADARRHARPAGRLVRLPTGPPSPPGAA